MNLMTNNITSSNVIDIGHCIKDLSLSLTQEFLSLFYILYPYDHIKEEANQVPNYEVALIPVTGILIITEQIIRLIKRQDLSRFQDFATNLGSSLIFTLARSLLLGVVVSIFSWIYSNYRIVDLPLYSIRTWILCLLLVEFAYYWTHRALHEINILWAAHQFHHMAEDVNITTTIRDSIVDLILYDLFPVPLALIVPPSILVVHLQFSLIYQIWLHNEVIGHLGPIEYLINTPRQHRVHHGKNPYCIDKNYGALLMIWDRLFGTYQTEKGRIIFGVVSPTPKTYDPITLQFGYYRNVVRKFLSVQGLNNKLSALFKGPGWEPGMPRLGLIENIPEPDLYAPKYSYDPLIPLWKKLYVLIHGTIILIAFFKLADHPTIVKSPLKGFLAFSYITILLTSIGAIFDARRIAPFLEIFRCLIYFAMDYYLVESVDWAIGSGETFILGTSLWLIRIAHILSILFWMAHFFVTKQIKHLTVLYTETASKSLEKYPSTNFERCLFFVAFDIMVVAFLFTYIYSINNCKDIINYLID